MSATAETRRKIQGILRTDSRYRFEAYEFTLEALNQTLEARRSSGQEGHITGQELLLGIRDYGRAQFGYLGAVVMKEWGVTRTDDFGDIVFSLVEAQLLSKQESDSKSDFAQGFDLTEAFEGAFLHP